MPSGSTAGAAAFTDLDKLNVQQDTDGTAAAPSITFGNDTDSGIYSDTANTVQISTGGTERVQIDSTGLTVTGSVVIGSAAMSEADLELSDGITAGTSAASKVVTLDANSELDGLGLLQKEDTIIASSAVLTLNATPVSILTAPAAGIYRVPEAVYVFLDYNSAAYAADAGEDITIQKASAGDVTHQTLDGTLFTGTADALAVAYPLNGDASTVNDRAAAAGLEITIASGEWLTGDSPLKVRVLYRDYRAASFEAIA